MPSTDNQVSCVFEVPLDTCYKLVGMISVALLSGIDDPEQEASLLRMALKPTGLTTTSIVQTYKETIHNWFPILEDEQLYRFLEPSILRDCHGIDGMLLLSMALVSQPPCEHRDHDVHSNLYKAVKQSFLLLQTTEKPRIQVLQIGLLLSLFEYGHGLGQGSELTVAACAAICKSQKSFCNLKSKGDEENRITTACRRAVVIMDWYVHAPEAYRYPMYYIELNSRQQFSKPPVIFDK